MIVVYTPYGRTETTAAAIRLAELAVAAGLPTRLVSVGPHESRVHPFWDKHVVSGRDGGLVGASAGATTCVWFVYGEFLRRAAAQSAPKAVHILVPPWHGLPKPNTSLFPPYESIVCPSKHHHAAFLGRVVPDQDAATAAATWARWDAGFPPVRHDGRAESGRLKGLVFCDTGAIDECPAVTLRIMAGLLERCDALHLTCLSTKSWSRPDRRKLAELAHTWGDRFAVLRPTDFQDQLTLMHGHDWFVYPAARTDFAFHPVRALHCGLPVAAWDVPPISERVRTGHNGVVVPCEIFANWANAPTAAAAATKFIDTVAPYLCDPRQLFALQREDWHLKEYGDAFQQFWLELFGATDK